MSTEPLSFNGIDASTGDYLLELTQDDLAKVAQGEELDPRALSELRFRHRTASESHYGVKEGVDVHKLEETGWAVVFPSVKPGSPEEAEQAAIREALRPLLDLRRSQASQIDERHYQEYAGPEGYRRGERKPDFLKRHGVGPGPADPAKMPYYLLLVGDPDEIPYRVQSQLGVQRAVGRLHFDDVEDYARYARSVVAAETQGLTLPRRVGLFGVANANDAATQASSKHLVEPLAELFEDKGWSVEQRLDEQATREGLLEMLRDTPPLMFTASHGMGFPKDDPRQLAHQGALLCQDWPGPLKWRRKPIPEEFYLAGEHLGADTQLLGSILFLFACYGAGTPEFDEFSKRAFKEREAIAPKAFVAGLPKALLGHPNGGALAVVGHVERAWGYSFMWAGAQRGMVRQTEVFESTLRALMGGMPIGAAMEYFHERYAELASDLSVQLEELDAGMHVDEYELAEMWTANNDARGYAILGDPAVRLSVGDEGSPGGREAVSLRDLGQRAPEPEAIAATSLEPERAAAEEPDEDPAEDFVESVESFGLLDRVHDVEELADLKPAEFEASRHLLRGILGRFKRAIADASTLEVSTWTSEDPEGVRFEGNKATGAQLRALTRIQLDGDTVVCLPQKDGQVDREVWELHMQMVRQAQEQRIATLETMLNALAKLSKLV